MPVGVGFYDCVAFSLPPGPLADAGSGSGNPLFVRKAVDGEAGGNRYRGRTDVGRYILYGVNQNAFAGGKRNFIFMFSVSFGGRRLSVYAWAFYAGAFFGGEYGLMFCHGFCVFGIARTFRVFMPAVFIRGLDLGMRAAGCILFPAVCLSGLPLALYGNTGGIAGEKEEVYGIMYGTCFKTI